MPRQDDYFLEELAKHRSRQMKEVRGRGRCR